MKFSSVFEKKKRNICTCVTVSTKKLIPQWLVGGIMISDCVLTECTFKIFHENKYCKVSWYQTIVFSSINRMMKSLKEEQTKRERRTKKDSEKNNRKRKVTSHGLFYKCILCINHMRSFVKV